MGGTQQHRLHPLHVGKLPLHVPLGRESRETRTGSQEGRHYIGGHKLKVCPCCASPDRGSPHNLVGVGNNREAGIFPPGPSLEDDPVGVDMSHKLKGEEGGALIFVCVCVC